MAKAKKAPKRKTSLAAFLRKLWSRPELMEQFSESREGREKVLSQFKLSAKHARMVREGCVHDIVVELAGGDVALNSTIVVNSSYAVADVKCGHAECRNFMATVAKQPRKKSRKRRK